MKKRTLILSALVCLCGAANAGASECTGAGCEFEPAYYGGVQQPTVLAGVEPTTVPMPPAQHVVQTVPALRQYARPAQYIYPSQIPMRQVKLLSIKPVQNDDRPPVWDGTTGQYVARGYDKTVDWRDGVPIWDDSISDYTKKDFSDWFLQPMPELYLRESDASYENPSFETQAGVVNSPALAPARDVMDDYALSLYQQNMADAAATRERVEELLSPRVPSGNLWANAVAATEEIAQQNPTANISVQAETTCTMPAPVAAPAPAPAPAAAPCAAAPTPAPIFMAPRPEYVAQDMSQAVKVAFLADDGCPFESETECNIWRRKPIIRETVSPRSPKLRAASVEEFVDAARCNKKIDASAPVAAPLLDRYKMLMRSAKACCTDGLAYSLRQAGASEGLIYKFLADDANFYGLGSRCLMITDQELDTKYPNTATASVAADVRNGCLCRGRQWFNAMLAPFQQVYEAYPEFKDAKFYYTYTDGLQRKTTVSINNDVQNVMNQLALCP